MLRTITFEALFASLVSALKQIFDYRGYVNLKNSSEEKDWNTNNRADSPKIIFAII
jgi:hypothetical protein